MYCCKWVSPLLPDHDPAVCPISQSLMIFPPSSPDTVIGCPMSASRKLSFPSLRLKPFLADLHSFRNPHLLESRPSRPIFLQCNTNCTATTPLPLAFLFTSSFNLIAPAAPTPFFNPLVALYIVPNPLGPRIPASGAPAER